MFERHFTTATSLNWEASAGLFGISVTTVTNTAELREALAETPTGTRLIVARTDRAEAKAFRDEVLGGFRG